MIGELFETGVFSAIRDWKIVMESIMATPKERKFVKIHVFLYSSCEPSKKMESMQVRRV